MIVVDTNYFLRFLTRPVTPQDHEMFAAADTLFRGAETGALAFTTTDAIVAEVAFGLQRHYGAGRPEVADALRRLLRLKGCRLPTRAWCIAAFDVWETNPKLSYVDALAAVQARETGSTLATFDQDLSRAAGVALWQPPPAADGKP